MNETTKKLTDEQADALIEQAIGRNWQKWHGTETLRRVVRHVSDSLSSASAPEPVALTDGKWDGAEEWMPLAWELCANECGEDACTELVWEGSPIPEPWGDRWLEYEDQAKEMISMVRKHVPALAASQPAPVALTDIRAVFQKEFGPYGMSRNNEPGSDLDGYQDSHTQMAWRAMKLGAGFRTRLEAVAPALKEQG